MQTSRPTRSVDRSIRAFIAVLAAVLTIGLTLASPRIHAAVTSPIGATTGSFSVNANGGANYTIPIQIPPGTAGLAPSLALLYSAQVDSGILAKGWSISGLSVIQRCGRTIALDGQKGGVNFDDNDRSPGRESAKRTPQLRGSSAIRPPVLTRYGQRDTVKA
jgi:hypothetical protein